MAARKKKKHEEHEGHANHERWVLSYADILTLLLALFIVMFAISRVDQKKFEEFARGTAEGFGNVAVPGQTGAFEGGDGVLTDQKPEQPEEAPAPPDEPDSVLAQEAVKREKERAAAASAEKRNLEAVKEKIAAALAKKGMSKAVNMKLDDRGLVVNIVTDKVLFDTGKAQLKPTGTSVLDAIAPALKPLPNTISVEGHTDNVPIAGSYRSNWALSADRATMVTEHLIKVGIDANRMSPAQFADTKPLASNDTEAGRARNRRVAVVVLPYLPKAEAEGGLAPADRPKAGTQIVVPTPTVSPPAPAVEPALAPTKP